MYSCKEKKDLLTETVAGVVQPFYNNLIIKHLTALFLVKIFQNEVGRLAVNAYIC
jgi:hypothetical protein